MESYGKTVQLDAELVLELLVNIDSPIVVGQTTKGYLKIIPITGGSFQGEHLQGTVISGGADWNTTIGDGPQAIRQIFAKYSIQTNDGAVISVENEGWKSVHPDNATVIATVPKLQTADPRYDWLNYGVYVGSLTPYPQSGCVMLKFYRMK